MKEQHAPSTAAIATSLWEIALVVLKLCGVIDWSWWWVLSPIWISTTIVIGMILVLVIVAIITATRKEKERDDR